MDAGEHIYLIGIRVKTKMLGAIQVHNPIGCRSATGKDLTARDDLGVRCYRQ